MGAAGIARQGIGRRPLAAFVVYVQDVRYATRAKEGGSGDVQDVRYATRAREGGSGDVQDVRYVVRGTMPVATIYR